MIKKPEKESLLALAKKKIPNSAYGFLVLAVFGFAVLSMLVSVLSERKEIKEEIASIQTGTARSLLSERAERRVQMGDSRRDVLQVMGFAKWAILPQDGGKLSLPNAPMLALRLRWDNPACRDIFVDFDQQDKVIAVDYGDDYCDTERGVDKDRYSCTKEERAEYCKF